MLYILLCEEEKYYIGVTRKKVEDRFNEHLLGIGCKWTKRYKPIKIIKIIENADEVDEDKWTITYMKEFGIDNVRGGRYNEIKLDNFTKSILEREIGDNEWYIVESKDYHYPRENESFVSKFWKAMDYLESERVNNTKMKPKF